MGVEPARLGRQRQRNAPTFLSALSQAVSLQTSVGIGPATPPLLNGRLSALRLHNGTVWRWNHGCCGVEKGRPHLRNKIPIKGSVERKKLVGTRGQYSRRTNKGRRPMDPKLADPEALGTKPGRQSGAGGSTGPSAVALEALTTAARPAVCVAAVAVLEADRARRRADKEVMPTDVAFHHATVGIDLALLEACADVRALAGARRRIPARQTDGSRWAVRAGEPGRNKGGRRQGAEVHAVAARPG